MIMPLLNSKRASMATPVCFNMNYILFLVILFAKLTREMNLNYYGRSNGINFNSVCSEQSHELYLDIMVERLWVRCASSDATKLNIPVDAIPIQW